MKRPTCVEDVVRDAWRAENSSDDVLPNDIYCDCGNSFETPPARFCLPFDVIEIIQYMNLLEAQNKKLLKAIKPLAEMSKAFYDWQQARDPVVTISSPFDENNVSTLYSIKIGDCRKADKLVEGMK